MLFVGGFHEAVAVQALGIAQGGVEVEVLGLVAGGVGIAQVAGDELHPLLAQRHGLGMDPQIVGNQIGHGALPRDDGGSGARAVPVGALFLRVARVGRARRDTP
ncbi:hypothetical protein D3C81_2004920 [compost metagenome]